MSVNGKNQSRSEGCLSDPLLRHCPVCGHDQTAPFLKKRELTLVRCVACAMIYANPAPAEYASAREYTSLGEDYYLSPAKLESDYADVRFERELRILRKRCPTGKVLDVGCSSGAFLYQLHKRFPEHYQVLGMDASGPALDYAEKMGIPIVRGDFLKHDFGKEKFSAVTFWAVLEHVLEPGAFLAKAWSVLDDQGLCFVLVPNVGSLAARFLGWRYRYIYPQHLNYFIKAAVRQMASKRFEPVEWHFTHFNPLVIWQDWRSGGAEVSNQARASLLQRTTAYKQSALIRPARLIYHLTESLLGALHLSDNIVAVFRRIPNNNPQ
jgi:SAM-dependent methyltransferase